MAPSSRIVKRRRDSDSGKAMILKRNGFHPELNWVGELRLSDLRPAYSTALGATFMIDAIELLRRLPSNSVDLVMTSPPFALTPRKSTATSALTDTFNGSCRSAKKLSGF